MGGRAVHQEVTIVLAWWMNQKKAMSERDNALLPHNEEFVNHVFSTIATWPGLKVHTSEIILFYIGKQRIKCR